MASPNRLRSCCGCYSLKTGTVIAGTLGILLAIATIVVILTTKIDFKTIVSDPNRRLSERLTFNRFRLSFQIFDEIIPKWVLKIILIVNLCMTIILCALLIIGAIIVSAHTLMSFTPNTDRISFFSREINTSSCHGSYWELCFASASWLTSSTRRSSSFSIKTIRPERYGWS
jgi:hypothetical protein